MKNSSFFLKKILILFAYFKKKCYLCSVINEGLQRENLDALDKKRRTKKTRSHESRNFNSDLDNQNEI